MSLLRRRVGLLAVLAWVAWIAPPTPAPPDSGTVILVEIKDAIGPATKEHFLTALEHAEESSAELLVLVLDTPGGLDVAMRDMIQGILASKVPVATFVAPSGARAASAGTFILYASHIAAMAPGTNVGAATPVPIGGSPPADENDHAARDGDKQKPEASHAGSASDRKAVNDAIAYIRSLADLRGRDSEFAEAAVREAASLPAQKALERGVIDLIATDVPELLQALDGREIRLGREARILKTKGAVVERIEMNWRISLLAVLTNPMVAYGLLLIGLYGLMFEGYSPGAVLPGVVGAVCLLLGLYALQVLSVNFAGLALVVLGVAMMIAEFFVPSLGALGFGGLVAFVIGSVVLMDTDTAGMEVSRGLIGGIATVGGTLMLAHDVDGNACPTSTGLDRSGTAGRGHRRGGRRFQWGGPSADLRRAVERGQSRTGGRGQQLRIDRVDGLTLYVSPIE